MTRRDVSSPDCNFRAIFLITLFVPSISEEEEEEEALLAVAKRRFFFVLLFFLQFTPPRVRKGGERGGENIIIIIILLRINEEAQQLFFCLERGKNRTHFLGPVFRVVLQTLNSTQCFFLSREFSSLHNKQAAGRSLRRAKIIIMSSFGATTTTTADDKEEHLTGGNNENNNKSTLFGGKVAIVAATACATLALAPFCYLQGARSAIAASSSINNNINAKNILLSLKAENDGRLTSSSFSSSSSNSHEQRRATDYGIERESKLGEKSSKSVDVKRNNNNNNNNNNKRVDTGRKVFVVC